MALFARDAAGRRAGAAMRPAYPAPVTSPARSRQTATPSGVDQSATMPDWSVRAIATPAASRNAMVSGRGWP